MKILTLLKIGSPSSSVRVIELVAGLGYKIICTGSLRSRLKRGLRLSCGLPSVMTLLSELPATDFVESWFPWSSEIDNDPPVMLQFTVISCTPKICSPSQVVNNQYL